MLCIVLMCQLIMQIIIVFHCTTFYSSYVRLLFSFDSFTVHYSLFKRKRFNSDPGLYSRYFDPVVCEVPVVPAVQEISSSSMQVNKHHTSDCTDFVLVQEQVAYYEQRHSGIYETSIFQVVKQAEGETLHKAQPSEDIAFMLDTAFIRHSFIRQSLCQTQLV